MGKEEPSIPGEQPEDPEDDGHEFPGQDKPGQLRFAARAYAAPQLRFGSQALPHYNGGGEQSAQTRVDGERRGTNGQPQRREVGVQRPQKRH